MNIHTILFDLDGTLIDTNELINQSFMHTFKHYGLDFTKEEIRSFNGPPLRDTFEKIDKTKVDEMVDVYREHNLSHHEQYVKIFPNVLETLSALRDQGVQLGIVTTKMRNSVELGLKITGLEGFFQSIVTLDDVTHAKPHPEPVFMGLKELGGDRETTLMVGDNSHDIEAGHHAGVRTAGVAWSHKGKEFLEEYKPTYMLEDMRDLLQLVK
ncbi:pyrophosphatase PpaX [Oceanobacillus limi]|uniref:Pyrophosphatase PpaX n=1 Tax=Oceanobacillus limi TaxID=930131 RepID=A0A1I0BTE3_9BACI|nr:pyrophosphatase PpaX [Oceanobacillus limi]SET10321.1 pyrophosphatase PpaX [Oceanobacillus limi]